MLQAENDYFPVRIGMLCKTWGCHCAGRQSVCRQMGLSFCTISLFNFGTISLLNSRWYHFPYCYHFPCRDPFWQPIPEQKVPFCLFNSCETNSHDTLAKIGKKSKQMGHFPYSIPADGRLPKSLPVFAIKTVLFFHV